MLSIRMTRMYIRVVVFNFSARAHPPVKNFRITTLSLRRRYTAVHMSLRLLW